jgi:hypothetical protein
LPDNAATADQRLSWPSEQLELLRELWPTHSASIIAGKLDGRTRNAVIGMARRQGLAKPERPKRQRQGHYHERVDNRVRKAYASKGDDCTLSRFVKVKGARPTTERKSKQLWFDGTKNDSIRRGRSLFHRKGVKRVAELGHVFVSGHSNVKIGRDVRKGKLFRGYWIYTLSLEERATCPRTCLHWDDCYGNNMPYAKRVAHGPELEHQVEVEVGKLMANKVWPTRAHATGILIRLHALGDFYSPDYVRLWSNLLDRFPKLAVYGYTARRPSDEIGVVIAAAKARHGRRFAIRWSDGGAERDCTVSIRSEDDCPPDAFVCPEQTWKTAACATCGLCWNSTRNVAFLDH